MKSPLLLFSLLILFFAACGPSSNTHYEVSADSVKAVLNNKDVVILDVRTPEEYEAGHLPGAINIDYKNSDFTSRLDSIDKNKTYEVYCRSGHRSGESVKIMEKKGFKNIHNMEGGILGWQEKGFPVER